MINILVADDHPIIRQGIKQILSETPDIVVKDEAANGTDTLTKINSMDFDVVLMDLSMPGISGMDVLKQIKRLKPKLPVLILSRYSEDQFAIPVLKAGASGYVSKTTIVEDLVNALRKVASGKEYVSQTLAEKLALQLKHKNGDFLHSTLSDRELEIMLKLASGKSITEIAETFCLSATTVSTYRSRVLHKMGMKNNAELVRYAMENDLLE
jgi:DNA-binding NarL/FixJ family response regulator